jgi:multicomponent Na+:H+ antiporter subunit B
MAGMTLIVRTIARLLFPFTFLFGVYVVIHGHLTPGGGFPGGVIIAASVLLMILAYGIDFAHRRMGFVRSEVLESVGGTIIIILGIFGVLLGTFFLQNVFPLGDLGKLFSGGNLPLLYLGVGIKVTAGIILIFYAMLFAFRRKKR